MRGGLGDVDGLDHDVLDRAVHAAGLHARDLIAVNAGLDQRLGDALVAVVGRDRDRRERD